MASFALGEKAMEAARAGGFPPPVMEILADARKYAEGAAVRIEVHTADAVVADVGNVRARHRIAGPAHSGDDSPQKQERQRWSKRHR